MATHGSSRKQKKSKEIVSAYQQTKREASNKKERKPRNDVGVSRPSM